MDIAEESLERSVETYLYYTDFKDKEELDKKSERLSSQIKMFLACNIINFIMAQEYLASMEKRYIEALHSERFKEWREQIINLNDDFISDRERLFHLKAVEKDVLGKIKKESESFLSMEEWKDSITATGTETSGANERNDVFLQREEIEKKKASLDWQCENCLR